MTAKQKAPNLPAGSPARILYDWLFSMPPHERELVLGKVGLSLPAILTKLYSIWANGDVGMGIGRAIAIDKASNGAVDFRILIRGHRDIDWAHAKRAMNERPKPRVRRSNASE